MRIGFLQPDPVFGEVEGNLTAAEAILGEQDADLWVLPELFATGYQFASNYEVNSLSEQIPDGRTTRWQEVTGDESGYVRLNPHFQPNDWVAAYLQTFLYSPDEREALLLLGADDGHVLWVNGERLSERQSRNISVPDEIEIGVSLRQGWNNVLLKVADLDGGWAIHLRAADPDGELRWSPYR